MSPAAARIITRREAVATTTAAQPPAAAQLEEEGLRRLTHPSRAAGGLFRRLRRAMEARPEAAAAFRPVVAVGPVAGTLVS